MLVMRPILIRRPHWQWCNFSKSHCHWTRSEISACPSNTHCWLIGRPGVKHPHSKDDDAWSNPTISEVGWKFEQDIVCCLSSTPRSWLFGWSGCQGEGPCRPPTGSGSSPGRAHWRPAPGMSATGEKLVNLIFETSFGGIPELQKMSENCNCVDFFLRTTKVLGPLLRCTTSTTGLRELTGVIHWRENRRMFELR